MFQEDSMGWGRLNLSDSRVACTRGLPLLAILWDETPAISCRSLTQGLATLSAHAPSIVVSLA